MRVKGFAQIPSVKSNMIVQSNEKVSDSGKIKNIVILLYKA